MNCAWQIFQEPKKANQVEQVLVEYAKCIKVSWAGRLVGVWQPNWYGNAAKEGTAAFNKERGL